MTERLVEFEITNRARQYGYVIWPKRRDAELRALLGDRDRVGVVMNGNSLGDRRVDWKYRRISVGPKATRALGDDQSRFQVTIEGDRLSVATS